MKMTGRASQPNSLLSSNKVSLLTREQAPWQGLLSWRYRGITAQWAIERIPLSFLSVARVQFPAVGSFSRDFFLADFTLPTRPGSAWQKKAQSSLNGITQSEDIDEKGLRPTTAKQWPKIIQGQTQLGRFSLTDGKCHWLYTSEGEE